VEAGARVWRLSERRVAVATVLDILGREEITSLLLEGGPTVAGSFWNAGLIDRVVAFIAPKLLGDPRAIPMLIAGPSRTMGEACQLVGVETRRFGEDIMITGCPAAAEED
jgi:diaminohydroxyphosphoribosylaminopyrimidine deaminase/5-amino-6-(5-phosphoribosylamino)uracil reductase